MSSSWRVQPHLFWIHGASFLCWFHALVYLKAGTHQPNHLTSGAFGESRTRSETNMFAVFSCIGSFRSRADVVCSNWTCEVWGGGPSDVWAIEFSDWRCASESARCVGGLEYCVCIGFLRTPFRHSLLSCFAVLAQDQMVCPFRTN